MMLLTCIVLFSMQLFAVLFLFLGRDKLGSTIPSANTDNPIKGISVVIPFHNEEERILSLISYLNQSEIPENIEFLFVNDHSTDSTVELLRSKLDVAARIVNSDYDKGKKWAILAGVQCSVYEYVLTWDADVVPAKEYFKAIFNIRDADLVILPVNMTGKTILGELASIEFSFLQMLTFGLSGFGFHILNNGANLMFKKEAFFQVQEARKDYGIPSGDDHFLLQAILKVGGKVVAAYKLDGSLCVNTNAPDNYQSIIKQRKRWLSKMSFLENPLSLLSGCFLFLIQLGFVISLIGCFYSLWFLIPLGIKFFAEFLASSSFLGQSVKRWFGLVLHQFWYPLYMVRLLFPAQKESKWR